jgi:hypothetical protein
MPDLDTYKQQFLFVSDKLKSWDTGTSSEHLELSNMDVHFLKHLSFRSFQVENFQFLPSDNTLNIQVEGCILNMHSKIKVGQVSLRLSDWEDLAINNFDRFAHKWCKDICPSAATLDTIGELKMNHSIICLSGFSKTTTRWTEWHFYNVNISARFQKNKQESYEPETYQLI